MLYKFIINMFVNFIGFVMFIILCYAYKYDFYYLFSMYKSILFEVTLICLPFFIKSSVITLLSTTFCKQKCNPISSILPFFLISLNEW